MMLNSLKIELREEEYPFFSDEELMYYLKKNNNNLKATVRECALMKAEDESITLPNGLTLPSNRQYWLKLAAKNKTNHTGVK